MRKKDLFVTVLPDGPVLRNPQPLPLTPEQDAANKDALKREARRHRPRFHNKNKLFYCRECNAPMAALHPSGAGRCKDCHRKHTRKLVSARRMNPEHNARLIETRRGLFADAGVALYNHECPTCGKELSQDEFVTVYTMPLRRKSATQGERPFIYEPQRLLPEHGEAGDPCRLHGNGHRG